MVSSTLTTIQPVKTKQISLTRLNSSDILLTLQKNEENNFNIINTSLTDIVETLKEKYRISGFEFVNIAVKKFNTSDADMFTFQETIFSKLEESLNDITKLFNSRNWLCNYKEVTYVHEMVPSCLLKEYVDTINNNWSSTEYQINIFYKLLYQATFTRGFYFG